LTHDLALAPTLPRAIDLSSLVALARKLLVALWRFVTQGVVPKGAAMKPVS
jgi:transposase